MTTKTDAHKHDDARKHIPGHTSKPEVPAKLTIDESFKDLELTIELLATEVGGQPSSELKAKMADVQAAFKVYTDAR